MTMIAEKRVDVVSEPKLPNTTGKGKGFDAVPKKDKGQPSKGQLDKLDAGRGPGGKLSRTQRRQAKKIDAEVKTPLEKQFDKVFSGEKEIIKNNQEQRKLDAGNLTGAAILIKSQAETPLPKVDVSLLASVELNPRYGESITQIPQMESLITSNYGTFYPRTRMEFFLIHALGEFASPIYNEVDRLMKKQISLLRSRARETIIGLGTSAITVTRLRKAMNFSSNAYILHKNLHFLFAISSYTGNENKPLVQWANKLSSGGIKINRKLVTESFELCKGLTYYSDHKSVVDRIHGIYVENASFNSVVRVLLPSVDIYSLTNKDSDRGKVLNFVTAADLVIARTVLNDATSLTANDPDLQSIRMGFEEAFGTVNDLTFNFDIMSDSDVIEFKPMSSFIECFLANRNRSFLSIESGTVNLNLSIRRKEPWLVTKFINPATADNFIYMSQYSPTKDTDIDDDNPAYVNYVEVVDSKGNIIPMVKPDDTPTVGLISDGLVTNEYLEYYIDNNYNIVGTSDPDEIFTFSRRWEWDSVNKVISTRAMPSTVVSSYNESAFLQDVELFARLLTSMSMFERHRKV
jgi:hypothetical protein